MSGHIRRFVYCYYVLILVYYLGHLAARDYVRVYTVYQPRLLSAAAEKASVRSSGWERSMYR